jgi:kynurenine formamidase
MLDSNRVLFEHRARIDQITQRITREIVASRPEPASHNHGIMRRTQFTECRCKPSAIVCDGPALARHAADRLKRARDPRGVCVLDLSEHEFITNRQDRNARECHRVLLMAAIFSNCSV